MSVSPWAISERWRKRISEAVVIMLSILAAFAIDAWWDARQQHQRAAGEVVSLRSEFEAVDRELQRAAAELQTALDATHELARLAGPRPAPIANDRFGVLFTQALTINAVELPTGALANMLSSGGLPILGDLELQASLASWPSIAGLMSVKFEHLVADRSQSILPLVNRLTAISPLLTSAFPQVWVDDHRFEFDGAAVLASREFESLMAERWIGIQIAAYTVVDARKLVATIRSGLLAWQ